MIVFIIYLLVLCFLVYRTSFFGVLKDDVLNKKFFLSVFLIKVLALAAFYIVYMKLYGSIQYSDTGNFYRDSKAINDIAFSNFGEFVKLMFGVQDDSEGSYIFENFLEPTTTWDKAPGEILYNDNRLILRFHALIHFISDNYFVHALVSCFLSLLGINWLYKTFKDWFKDKEIYFFLVWVLFPGVWFWTGGLFKEGPAVFLMGLTLVSLKRVLVAKYYSVKNLLMLIIGAVLSFLFKPYLMVPLFLSSALFFLISSHNKKLVGLKYFGLFLLILLLGNFSMQLLFKKDAVKILSERQRDFVDNANGGMFLLGDDRFIRVPYNYNSLQVDSTQQKVTAKIKPGVSYVYWEHTHQQDTLKCNSNSDTSTVYQILYVIPKANSTLQSPVLNGSWASFLKSIPFALYITTCKPFFVDARNVLDLLTSVENLMVILSLLLFMFSGLKNGFKDYRYVYLFSFILLILIFIGITSPNLGAIQRYRAPVLPFMVLTTLLSSHIKDYCKLSNFFKNHT